MFYNSRIFIIIYLSIAILHLHVCIYKGYESEIVLNLITDIIGFMILLFVIFSPQKKIDILINDKYKKEFVELSCVCAIPTLALYFSMMDKTGKNFIGKDYSELNLFVIVVVLVFIFFQFSEIQIAGFFSVKNANNVCIEGMKNFKDSFTLLEDQIDSFNKVIFSIDYKLNQYVKDIDIESQELDFDVCKFYKIILHEYFSRGDDDTNIYVIEDFSFCPYEGFKVFENLLKENVISFEIINKKYCYAFYSFEKEIVVLLERSKPIISIRADEKILEIINLYIINSLAYIVEKSKI